MEPNESVHHEVLPNGLTILLRETHIAPVANIQIWANVGSADEKPDEAGLAHFHEHMLFKGTERRGVGEVAGEVEGAGGRINAYTSYDTTVYYATLPSEALSTGLDVLVDAVRNSLFDPDEIEREIEVVLEEIRRSQDTPHHVLSDAVFAEHYRVHPYRLPILGSMESVSGITRERVTDFWKRWYTPENMLVVGAGDFDAREIAREIGAQFADAEPGRMRRGREIEPRQDAMRSVILQRHFERVRVELDWPAAAFRDQDATYLDLLSFILGECESSRLVRKVRENEGLADRIDSSSYTPLDAGVFSVNVEVDEKRAKEAIAATIREVERIRREPVSDEELERARANFLATEHFERESVSGLASKLGNFHVIGGDWRSEEKYFETLRGATAADLQRVAREYLAPETLTVGVLLPEGGASVLDRDGVQAAVQAGIESCGETFAPPARSNAGAASRVAGASTSAKSGQRSSKIHSYELSNGAQVHVLPRREIPVVAVRAAFLGGLLAQDEGKAGIDHFLTNSWMRGTGTRSAGDFARAVENLAAEIDGFSGRSSLGLTLDVATEQYEPALDLFTEVLLDPGLAEEEVDRERRETLATIERLEDQLAHQAFALFGRTHFDAHPYRLPMIGTRESVGSFGPERLRGHHDRLIRGGNMVVAISGDVDPDEAAEGISRRLSAVPEGPSFRAAVPGEDAAPSEIRRARMEKDREQAHLVIGFRGVDVADPDRYALDVLSQMLAGQSGRLFLELRDKKSLAYTVSAMNVEGLAPGFFAIYIATAPDKVEEARSGILEEMEKLVAEVPGNQEFEHAKRHLIGNHAIDQQRNSTHAAHIALDSLYGLGAEASQGYAGEVEGVEKGDLLRVARRVIRLEAYTEAVVEP